MKSFKEFIQESAFQDPPTILTLRRTAVRMLPHHQSVATYRNNELNIEIAIPYSPGHLGKHRVNVAGVAEEVEDWINESLIFMEEENINEVMSPELKKIRKDRSTFQRDLIRAKDRLESARTRLDWSKRALKGHVKKHGKVLDSIGEEVIMEAAIHSLHAITRTQTPATIRFRDGSTAMVDHPTAQQIMHLHSKVNRLNKRKIESLLNSGPSGIKKVSKFYTDHVKQAKKG